MSIGSVEAKVKVIILAELTFGSDASDIEVTLSVVGTEVCSVVSLVGSIESKVKVITVAVLTVGSDTSDIEAV